MSRLAALFTLAASISLGACALLGGGIEVEDAWVRPALAGSNSAIYFRLINYGEPDQLIGVIAEAAPEAAVYRTRMDAQGFMHMEAQEDVSIPSGTELVFEPGGLHLMLIGLTHDLLQDERTSITLVFENAGTISVDVLVTSR